MVAYGMQTDRQTDRQPTTYQHTTSQVDLTSPARRPLSVSAAKRYRMQSDSVWAHLGFDAGNSCSDCLHCIDILRCTCRRSVDRTFYISPVSGDEKRLFLRVSRSGKCSTFGYTQKVLHVDSVDSVLQDTMDHVCMTNRINKKTSKTADRRHQTFNGTRD